MPVISPLTTTNYVFPATGNFSLNQSFANVMVRLEELLNQVNIKNTLQVAIDVARFNALLGLVKNGDNTAIDTTSFDDAYGFFTANSNPISSVSFDSAAFADSVEPGQVISLGVLSGAYANFVEFVNDFLQPSNFENNFTVTSSLATPNRAFNADDFLGLFSSQSEGSNGDSKAGISGSITLSNLESMLRSIVDNDSFANRMGKSVDDGFLDGDLLYVQNGFEITFAVNITNPSLALTAAGKTYTTALINSRDFTDAIVQSQNVVGYSQSTVINLLNPTLVTRTISVPLVIRLTNASTITTMNVVTPPTSTTLYQINFNLQTSNISGGALDGQPFLNNPVALTDGSLKVANGSGGTRNHGWIADTTQQIANPLTYSAPLFDGSETYTNRTSGTSYIISDIKGMDDDFTTGNLIICNGSGGVQDDRGTIITVDIVTKAVVHTLMGGDENYGVCTTPLCCRPLSGFPVDNYYAVLTKNSENIPKLIVIHAFFVSGYGQPFAEINIPWEVGAEPKSFRILPTAIWVMYETGGTKNKGKLVKYSFENPWSSYITPISDLLGVGGSITVPITATTVIMDGSESKDDVDILNHPTDFKPMSVVSDQEFEFYILNSMGAAQNKGYFLVANANPPT